MAKLGAESYMSSREEVHDLLYALITGAMSTREFSQRYLVLWRAMQDSDWIRNEDEYFQRGTRLIRSGIDSLDSDNDECARQERVQELLLTEVRAVFAVLWG